MSDSNTNLLNMTGADPDSDSDDTKFTTREVLNNDFSDSKQFIAVESLDDSSSDDARPEFSSMPTTNTFTNDQDDSDSAESNELLASEFNLVHSNSFTSERFNHSTTVGSSNSSLSESHVAPASQVEDDDDGDDMGHEGPWRTNWATPPPLQRDVSVPVPVVDTTEDKDEKEVHSFSLDTSGYDEDKLKRSVEEPDTPPSPVTARPPSEDSQNYLTESAEPEPESSSDEDVADSEDNADGTETRSTNVMTPEDVMEHMGNMSKTPANDVEQKNAEMIVDAIMEGINSEIEVKNAHVDKKKDAEPNSYAEERGDGNEIKSIDDDTGKDASSDKKRVESTRNTTTKVVSKTNPVGLALVGASAFVVGFFVGYQVKQYS